MTNILFFDVDDITRAYLKDHPIAGVQYVLHDFDINHPSVKTLGKELETSIISVFPHSDMVKNSVLDLFGNLKLIATRSTGFNHIDLNYAAQRQIAVENVPNYGEITVAEFTMGTMIGLARKIYKAKSEMKANNVHMNDYIGIDLSGRTLGVIGTGAIGRHVIRLATAFGMRILAYDPFPNAALKKDGISYVDLSTLYKQADIITLHCPATPENFHLLDQQAFAQMKKGVLIVNTARGSLIETEALYNALKSSQVGGAALDVLENEDVITHREIATDMDTRDHDFLIDSVINFKMMQLDTTIITPHVAFNSIDAVHRILQTTLDNIQAFLNGAVQNNVIK